MTVDVWPLALDGAPDPSFISPDEMERAARFRFPIHRTRFISCRSALRRILAGYVDVPPQEIRFEYGPQGKPTLAGNSVLEFSVTHTADRAMIAVAAGCAAGIDLERIRPMKDAGGMAKLIFSTRELAEWECVDPLRREQAFFQGWTRKEAYVKALGTGLSAPLREFDVAIDGPPRLLCIGGSEESARQWRLVDVSPGGAFIGCLAVASDEVEVVYRTLSLPPAAMI